MMASHRSAASKLRVYLAFVGLCLVLTSMPGGPQIPWLLWDLWSIARNPAEASGSVVRLDCPNHGRVEYAVDNGTTKIKGQQHKVAGADCRSLKVGQPITVVYDRSLPERNYAFASKSDGNPAEHEFYLGLTMWMSFVLLGPLLLVALWRIFSKVVAVKSH